MTKSDFFSSITKTQIVNLDDGQTVHIRKLSQGEVETSKRLYSSDDKALEGFRFIVCRCVVNEDGSRVFEDKDQSKLAETDYSTIEQIARAVLAFSGLTKPEKNA